MEFKKYESYKPSGIDWIGDIPIDWNASKIRYEYYFTTGWTPSTSNSDFFEGENKWVNISDLSDSKIINETVKRISDEAIKEGNIKKSKKGSLLFSFKLSIGQVAIAGEDLYTNEAIATFYSNKKNNINFLYYAAPVFIVRNAKENIYGAKLLNQNLINSAEILIPNENEQRQIADFLDRETEKIDKIIKAKEKLIELLKEKRQAIITHAVTKGINPTVNMKRSEIDSVGDIPKDWDIMKLRYIFRFYKGLSITKADLIDEGVLCVNYGEIHSKYGRELKPEIHELKCVSNGYLATDNNALLVRGDFVFADTSEDIDGTGNFTFLNSDISIFAGYHTIVLKPKKKLNSCYISYLFDSMAFRAQIRKFVTGTKVYSITNRILKSAQLLLPTYEEQILIVNRLEKETTKIDAIIKKTQDSINKMKEYITALITAAVTGKIDVRCER